MNHPRKEVVYLIIPYDDGHPNMEMMLKDLGASVALLAMSDRTKGLRMCKADSG